MSSGESDKADFGIRATFFIVAWVILFVMSAPLFRTWEGRFFPVVTQFRVTQIERQADSVVISGDVVKERDCRFLSLSIYAGDRHEPEQLQERLTVHFLDDAEDDAESRLVGRQTWGPWRVARPTIPNPRQVYMRVTHRCHGLWPTTTVQFERPAVELFEPDALTEAAPRSAEAPL